MWSVWNSHGSWRWWRRWNGGDMATAVNVATKWAHVRSIWIAKTVHTFASQIRIKTDLITLNLKAISFIMINCYYGYNASLPKSIGSHRYKIERWTIIRYWISLTKSEHSELQFDVLIKCVHSQWCLRLCYLFIHFASGICISPKVHILRRRCID